MSDERSAEQRPDRGTSAAATASDQEPGTSARTVPASDQEPGRSARTVPAADVRASQAHDTKSAAPGDGIRDGAVGWPSDDIAAEEIDALPDWLRPLAAAVASPASSVFGRYRPSRSVAGRASAVLILFGLGADGPDVLLEQKADTLRNHAGHPAFPGGGAEVGDRNPTDTALREATEETGLDPGSVKVFGRLPPASIPVSGYVVTPVLGWWWRPHPVAAADPGEVARVARVPVADLVDPANRVSVRHPSGYVGPGFAVLDMLVWGFTAGLLAGLLDAAGWSRPWDTRRVVRVDRGGVPLTGPAEVMASVGVAAADVPAGDGAGGVDSGRGVDGVERADRNQ